MCTELRPAGTQPTLLWAPLAFSCTFFFALYGPEYAASRMKSALCTPQSLKGTPSRPTVQSNRGSTVSAVDATRLASCAGLASHVGSVIASGSPVVPSTRKKLTRFCDG